MKKKFPFTTVTVMAIAITVTLTLICMVIEPLIAIAVIGVICIIGYSLYETIKNQPNKEEVQRRKMITTYDCMKRVIEKVYDVLKVKKPCDVNDIITEPYTIMKDGFPFVRCSVLKKTMDISDKEELHNILKILQTTMNNTLKSGEFRGIIPGISFDNRLPLFVIDDIKDNGAYYEIEVAVADNKDICDYLCRKKHIKSTVETPDKSDEEF